MAAALAPLSSGSRFASRAPREPRSRSGAAVKTRSIVVWMVLAIVAIAALAYWDEERESQSALDDFAHEQTMLAIALSSTLSTEPDGAPERVLAASRSIERPGVQRVLLALPDGEGFVTRDGEHVRSLALEQAVRERRESFRLSREDSAALGLPARMSIAGLQGIDTHAGRYTLAVVTTARLERDREQRARWRLVLGVLVASGLVLAFGGLAMRKQRKELELGHQLAMTTLQNERDERLVRADKLATMGALATGIAHEVATPLGVIMGRAEQLLPKQSDERSRRAVETIAAQTERIDAVIRGFLSLARGKQPTLEHCDPAVLARNATELVEHRFEKAGVQLSSDIAEDLPKVPCEPRLFEQVLVNLLLNACDACDEGGHVALTLRADEARVAFVVTDDGIGISADAADRVTEPFFTTKPEGKGTGLGLAIANEIVKHHCGALELTPRPDGRGTRACVELPIAVSDAHE